MAEKQRATQGATTESRKCKRKVTTEKNEESKKKRCTSKAMCKKDRTGLMESLQCLHPKILVKEMQRDVAEHFSDCNLSKFANELFENDEPMLEIARHHREAFVTLYGECKLLKNLCMEFQRHWHAHCSAFLLEEKYKLADINLKESDCGNSSLAAVRSIWLEFCKDHETPVPSSNPIMMTISSRAYFYLQDQVAMYQRELSMANDKSTEEAVSNGDSDDVYYCFGGAAICTMLKHRYKEIRRCSSDTKNALSIEICILQAMKIKDKSCIPGYLQYRDKGYMYFPQSSLIPFFRNFDGVLKEVVNEDGFHKHGADLIKVCKLSCKCKYHSLFLC